MITDFPTLFTALDHLHRWFQTLKSGRDQKSADEQRTEEQYGEALAAIYVALNETRSYVSRFSPRFNIAAESTPHSMPKRDLEKEADLARLWSNASLRLRPFNQDLAQRCFTKGYFWADPDSWNENEIKRARIKLDQVFKDIKELI